MSLETLGAILLALVILAAIGEEVSAYRRRVRGRRFRSLSLWPDGMAENVPPRAAGLRTDRRSVAQYHIAGWRKS